jgi:hypothetical protein
MILFVPIGIKLERKKKMTKIQGIKKKISSLFLILILAITLMMALPQLSLAQVGVPQPEKTVGYISVAPKLVGVDQTATVNLWIFPIPTTYLYSPWTNGYLGITVTFTKPDGTKDTFQPVSGTGHYVAGETEATGSLYFFYAPDMAGNWSASFTMPAQNITDNTGTVQYSACTSNTAYFTVQTDPVPAGLLNGYPYLPLPDPNVFWNYPINSNNRDWNKISGDWLGSGFTGNPIYGATCRLWQPYGSGPNTAHILWNQPLKAGGIIGGDYGSISYASAISLPEAVIMEGKAFTNIPNLNEFECIDLTTGKILYTAPGQITGGVHLPGNPFAQNLLATPGQAEVVLNSSYGSSPTPYLFSGGISTFVPGGTWSYYDPFTGKLMMSIENASISSYGLIDGTNLAYGTTTDGRVFAWDISNVIANNFLTSFYTPPGTVLTGDWPAGLVWTRPLPEPLISGGTAVLGVAATLFGISTDGSTIVLKTPNQYWGYSTKDGTSLWNLTLTYPVSQNEQMTLYGVNDFIIIDPVASTFKCYSMLTGSLLWTSPTFSDSPWATTWTIYLAETNDYNNFYAMFPDGRMRAYSLTDGQLVWTSNDIPSTEYTANAVPYVTGMLMVGGNIYGYAGYSIGYQINPIPRFAMMTCVNATTGDITYTLNGGVFPVAAADGYVIGLGIYDGKLYCVGKGKTQTTVTAPLTTVAAGTGVLIQGLVMDMSPASPNTPAISDADMSEWMDYLHMQNATLLNSPPTPNGVTVSVTALDGNGQYTDLGTTTSDYTGQFALSWTPPSEGMYKIFATFAGSESYYSSYAETVVNVGTTPQTPTDGGTEVQPVDNTMLLYGILVAVVIAIVLALIAIVAIFRKR